MKAKTLISSLLVLGLLGGFRATTWADEKPDKDRKDKAPAKEKARAAKDDSQMTIVAKAKVTRQEAEKIALARVPKGKVQAAELQMDEGLLVWSFELALPGSDLLAEVRINAVTGAVVGTDIEPPKAEAARAKEPEAKPAKEPGKPKPKAEAAKAKPKPRKAKAEAAEDRPKEAKAEAKPAKKHKAHRPKADTGKKKDKDQPDDDND